MNEAETNGNDDPFDLPPKITTTVARWFHEAYEQLAPTHDYETREASAVPWDDVPPRNKMLMFDTVAVVMSRLAESGVDLSTFDAGGSKRDGSKGSKVRDLMAELEASLAAAKEARSVDREPQPSDGPDYHADHAAWVERQRTIVTGTEAETVRVVQCECGKLKQQGFVCDFCFSTKDRGSNG